MENPQIVYVAIVGSRSYPNLQLVKNYVGLIHAKYPDVTIVSGEAKGVDRAAKIAATEIYKMKYIPFPPKIAKNASRQEVIAALFARNTEIVERCDVLVAFHDQNSTTAGTLDAIYKATLRGKHVVIYNQNGELVKQSAEEYLRSLRYKPRST